jgi:Uncharacterized protein SCO1/SenC/PrrC, involved in biogenesis of respiratory and photosynthetic systems
MNRLKYIGCILIALLVVSCVRSDDEPAEEYIQVGDDLPEFTVNGPSGTQYDSAGATGRITLICFFNTTCPDCHRELPKLQYVWERLEDNGLFSMVCIGRDRTLSEIAAYWNAESFTMPYYEDPLRAAYTLFATRTIPRIYLVDEDGIVRKMWVEEIGLSREQLLDAVKSYTGTP